ncbi:MAG TPA: ATP-binding protein [Gaiellaceae bacterium]|nr:ATP-binding protein [Gaiellaceae bacterium]
MASLLLVDDRQENLLTLRAILEPLGHELVTATSGGQALRTLLKRDDFAAILLDVQMQDMDGFEAAAVIKQRRSTSTIPIIFLTALSKDQEQVVRGYEVGAVDYVFKPFNPEILRAKVQVLVELWEKTQQVQEQAERLAEQELAELRRATEQRYQQLADAMPQIVWTADIEGRTTYYNQRWFDYTGLEPEEGAIAGWEIAVHPDDRREVMKKRRESLRTGGVFEAEYRMKSVSGDYRWHLGRALPIRDEDGAIDFWIGTATDLHDRKLAEEELAQRARASRVLETIADGVVLLDNDENVVLWNSAAAAITGLPADRVIGKRAPDVLPGYEQNIELVREGGRPNTVPVEIDGRELWLSFSTVSFDEGVVFAFRDLTEERAIEQVRSDFVATVSHELRTPLAAIYGAAVTLRRADLQLEDALKDRLLSVVADESERLAQIVNDVLLASHLDSGQLQSKIERVDPAKVTEHVIHAARAHLPEGVTLDVDAGDGISPVRADEQQLVQVLGNLVENAIKYSPDGGLVTIKVSGTENAVRWSVSDKGLGVPASERRRIFEKFYRLDPNMTRGVGGTGLGLYICRELVHRLDGRIWVEPNGRKGSTFVVEIPTVEQPAPTKRVKTAA